MPSLEKAFVGGVPRQFAALVNDGFLFENLPLGVYVCDRDGRLMRYNRAAVDLWGCEPSLGEPVERFCGTRQLLDLDGDAPAHAECLVAMALATGRSHYSRRVRIERPDGSRITALLDVGVLRDHDGHVIGAVSLVRENSRNRLGPGRREREELPVEQILQFLPAAIYTTDALGRITFYNEAAVELWGVRPDIGRSEFCGSWKLYWPDGTPLPHDECPMAVALKEQRAIDGL